MSRNSTHGRVQDGPCICMSCQKHFMVCDCPMKDMAYAIPTLPSTATAGERVQRYIDCVLYHPLAGGRSVLRVSR